MGPEISLKAARDPAVLAACHPVVVTDPDLVARHAKACGLSGDLRVIERVADADFSSGATHLLACRTPEAAALEFGAVSADSGRASLAFASAAIKAALKGEVDAVVAAPQNQTSIARAGIEFDGYPSFVARETGLKPHEVFLMLCFRDARASSMHAACRASRSVALITRERVARASRRRRGAEAARHRGAAHRRQRAKSACRRRRDVRPRGDRDHHAGHRRGRRAAASMCPARSAPTPCSTRRGATPSS